ncbi:MAG: signal peptidase I [Candidatus Omnitrophica bacterium]|nr:signal peptidase I [Candidatus Omnitrophota bacterium]
MDRRGSASKVALSLLKEGIENGRFCGYKVVSDSMSPLFGAGDIVEIRSVPQRDLVKGDIIAFKVDDQICVHRVIRRLKFESGAPRFITKADSMPVYDRWSISPEDIFGKVTTVLKDNRRLNLEIVFWRVNNYFLALISLFQAAIATRYKFLIRPFLLIFVKGALLVDRFIIGWIL